MKNMGENSFATLSKESTCQFSRNLCLLDSFLKNYTKLHEKPTNALVTDRQMSPHKVFFSTS
jgi:hypothetical protein